MVENKPPPQPVKKQKTNSFQKTKLLWTVRNRQDYTPTLFHPYDVTFLEDVNKLVIVEGLWPYSRLQMFDLMGKSCSTIGQGAVLPFGLALDSDGDFAVTDHKDRTVKVYKRDGNLKTSWQSNLFNWPKGICRTNDNQFIVTDWSQGEISIHEADGTPFRKFKSHEVGLSEYSCPEYVTTDTHGRIIVTDGSDHSVKFFDKTGQFLAKTQKTSENGTSLRDPRGLCIDHKGHILVNDWGNSRICQFDANGSYIQDLVNNSEISNPWGIAFGSDKKMVISEQKLNASPAIKMFQCE